MAIEKNQETSVIDSKGEDRPGNGHRNPLTLNFGTDEYLVYTGQTFLTHRADLVALASMFMQRELGWSLENSTKTIERGSRVTQEDLEDERRIPSMIVARNRGKNIGVSLQRCIFLDTSEEEAVPFFQHNLRAFIEGARGKGRGRLIVQLARSYHPEARYYGHRSMNPMAVYANLRSGIFVPGTYSPWEELFDSNRKKQELMVGYFMRARVNPTAAVDWATGVSKNDFPESNISCVPRPNHIPTMDIYTRMQEEFHMTLPNGRDVSHGVAELK